MTTVADQAAPVTAGTTEEQLLEEAAEDAHTVVKTWTRTPEQRAVITSYLEMIRKQYTDLGADPRLVALLTDETTIGTPEMCAMLGYKDSTRAFQLYSKRRLLEEADQVPHPSALPDADASGGYRGPRQIRGVMRGRMWHWMLQSCRGRWDPIRGEIVLQTGINAGGAPSRGAKRKS